MPDDARAGVGGLLLVHAHPDDEAMATGGVIARCVAEGIRVDLVTCTGGEEGEIHDPSLDPAESAPRLASIRAAELACALDALGDGAVNFHPLGYRDSGMMGTPPNSRADAFWNADMDVAAERLVSIVRSVRPAVIISYDSNGNYGHPDHINAYRIARAAFEAAGDPARYPDAGVPHTVAKRYEVAFSREHFFELMGEMQSRGIKLPWDFDESAAADAEGGAEAIGAGASDEAIGAATVGAATVGAAASDEAIGAGSNAQAVSAGSNAQAVSAGDLNPTNVEALRQVGEDLADGEGPEDFGTPDALITTRVDVAAYLDRKRACMDCHKTQRQDMGWVLDMPTDLADRVLTPERFVLAASQGREIPAGYTEDSLFSGL